MTIHVRFCHLSEQIAQIIFDRQGESHRLKENPLPQLVELTGMEQDGDTCALITFDGELEHF